MDTSLTRVGEETMHVYDSGNRSRIQLVFLPGVFSPDAWIRQINYFSREYRVLSFRPTVSERDFEGHKKCLEQILEEVENAVLVSANYSNPLAQGFESHENVSGTVLVSANEDLSRIPQAAYNFLMSDRIPLKIFRKLFMPYLEAGCVKNFREEVEFLKWDDFDSFRRNYSFEQPGKQSQIFHGERDFLSDRSLAMEMMSSASVAILDSGPFCFYERPKEFNETLRDLVIRLERKRVREEVKEAKERNKTLSEYEENVLEVKR